MSRTAHPSTRSQQVLQSYLDTLLQEVAVELEFSSGFDEFEAAVLAEQIRDARQAESRSVLAKPLALAEAKPLVLPTIELPLPKLPTESVQPAVEPVQETAVQSGIQLAPSVEGRPEWAEESFECLLFDVAGLTLAVPLVCLGSIYPLSGTELTPLFGQPDWFLGILPCQAGNLKVLDTARWVMPERYREDFREGLQYVISVEGYEWGLAVHQVSCSIRLNPSEIKWRDQRSRRPWLAGTVIEHMCALLDVSALAEMIASGAMRNGAVRSH